MNVIIQAAQFAERCHLGQRRKYTDTPYILHPGRVASRVCLLPGADEIAVAAAWLHDTIEDCGVSRADIEKHFGYLGNAIGSLVEELTNTSKHDFPHYNRARRKTIDRDRIRGISETAQNIKCIDRIDNLQEMTLAPKDFRRLYLEESDLLFGVLWKARPELRDELREAIVRGFDGVIAATDGGAK